MNLDENQVREYKKCASNPTYYLNNYGYVFNAGERKITPMHCFEYQNDCLLNFHKYQNNILLKSRQCLPENTFVDTPDGPKSIQSFKTGDFVYSYNLETNQVEMDTVADAWCSGDRQCVKIKLKDSRNIEVGENHPFWIINKQKWVKAKDLSIDDEILDANINFGEVEANESEIKMLVYLITDGCTNKQVKFTNNSLDYSSEFEISVNDFFPKLEIRKSKKLNGFDYFQHQKHGTSVLNPIMEWCETKGIANKKTEFKNLPEEVFYWNKKSISLLINRIFAGDGWISILKKKNNKKLELGLGSSSIIFLEQIKALLKKFNIKGNIYEVKNMKLQKNKFYKLRITHSKSTLKFIEEIGIYKKIKPEHLEIASNRKHNVKNNSKVRKITITEIKKCYDISVTKNENFLINGLLVHNTGLSVVTAGYVAWRLIFRYDEKILIIANDGAGAVRFLATVRQFLDYTPGWMLPAERVTDNQKMIRFSNGSYAEAKASSPQAGRGDSITMLVLDETAFIEDAEEIWMAAGMALSVTNGKCIMISCVPEGTIVFTDKGIKDIKSFIKKEKNGGYEIDSYNIFGKDKLREGNLFFNNGLHKTKILTSTNSQIEGTLTHKLWACKNGIYDWYKTEELNENDYISIQYGMEVWGNNNDISGFKPTDNGKFMNKFNPLKITKEVAYLIGLYISEGSVYKKIKEDGKFIGGSVTITCGDDVSNAISDVGLTYSCYDDLHYSIGSKNLIEFLEYVGFDLSKKAKEKEIPDRLLEMSRENIIYMLRGIFDGDGYSRQDKGYIGIGMNSKKLIQQIRMLLLNFGVLTDYYEVWTKITKKVKVKTLNYRISANAEFSKVFYEKIGFNFERKQNNKYVLEKYNLKRNVTDDVIPFSLDIIKNMVKESCFSSSYFKSQGLFINGILNSKKEYKTKNISRGLFLKVFDLCKKNISIETRVSIEKILSNNLKWNSINKIEYSESETYDFSLPDNKNDFWCHSVIYNGVLGHQTPNGTGNLYHRTWVDSTRKENKFFSSTVHWTENPISARGLEKRKNEDGTEVFWSPWYEEQCKRLNGDSVKIAQELDLSFEGSKRLAIESELITKYEARIKDDNKPFCYFDYDFKIKGSIEKPNVDAGSFVSHETRFHIFKKPQHGRKYILAADVARGDGKDFSTIQIIDAVSLEQVAEYQGKVPPDLFAYLIFSIAKLYNDAYVVVEANSFGLGTCFDLRNKMGYKNMFISKNVKEMHVRPYDYKVDEGMEIPGFQTTKTTRPLMITSLTTYMREAQLILHSTRLIQEFRTFINNNGKQEHEPGFNDDLIFALALALYIRDTEYNNVITSKDTFRSMLDAMSFQSNSSEGHEKDFKITAKKEVVTEFLIDCGNPEAFDMTVQRLGAASLNEIGDKGEYEKREGYYVMRVLSNPDFIEFSIKNQGYGKIIKRIASEAEKKDMGIFFGGNNNVDDIDDNDLGWLLE